MYASPCSALVCGPHSASVTIDRVGLAFTRALCAYVWRMHPDSSACADDLQAAHAVAQFEAPEWLWATDTGNTTTLWDMSFGAYGETHVWVLGDADMCGALEAAADVLPPGIFTDPDYRGSALELGRTWDDENADPDEETIEHAETDLTYTESGWIASWEWTGSRVSVSDLHAALDERIDRGRAVHRGFTVGFGRA